MLDTEQNIHYVLSWHSKTSKDLITYIGNTDLRFIVHVLMMYSLTADEFAVLCLYYSQMRDAQLQ